MLPDAEAQSSAPGDPDEVRSFDTESVENRHDIGDAQRHRVSLRFVRFGAPTVTSVIHVDESELRGELLQRSGDRRARTSSIGSRNPPRITMGVPSSHHLEVHPTLVVGVRRDGIVKPTLLTC